MFEVSIRLERTQYLAAEIVLEEFGAISTSTQSAKNQPVFIEELDSMPLWQHITLTALFAQELDTKKIQAQLENALSTTIEISHRKISDQDWQTKWMQNLIPMRFGERLWICPSGFTYPDPLAINIRLDPGLAFGTGTHATTALCLEWLANHTLAGKTIMDFGCGSGILAIAAYYLGAKKIYAIDHDLQAIQATRINAEKNKVHENILKISLGHTPTEHSCDIVIANVLLTPLINLRDAFAQTLAPSGKLILSGILDEQLNQLKQVYESKFKFDVVVSKNEWLLIEASHT